MPWWLACDAAARARGARASRGRRTEVRRRSAVQREVEGAMHQRISHAGRFVVIVSGLAALAASSACVDEPTAPGAPPPAPTSSVAATEGVPTGKIVVVFRDTASIPQAGI